jgi:hypothetical protein
MSNPINPFLWLDNQAAEAADFYAATFPGARLLGGWPPVVSVEVGGLKFLLLNEEDFHLGYLEDCPDYVTQGETEEELLENLKDLYRDISSGQVPYIRKVDELVFAT